ncbi:MAG: flagellar hook-associated protein FlgK [Lachnospiraceae bacterium]|nr:flagellar hook-associated protein FlgK [Lachnospiraceae bacterium]
MPSAFSGLMIGYSGLTAAQVANNTVANNIANVNTKGYSKQVLNTHASDAIQTYSTYGMEGQGVTADSVDQLRDAYIDLKYRSNATSLGEYSKKQTYTLEIENYFTDTATVPGFNKVYVEDFYRALTALKEEPGSTTARTAFIGQAQSLTEYFNVMASNMEQVQSNLNEEVKDAVDQINSIASQIATLNKQITVIELKGVVANELRDQREVLIDKLSNYVDVQTEEVDIYNYGDPDHPTGAKRFKVSIGNSCQLVYGYEYNELECRVREEKVNQSDIDGLYDIYWTHTGSEFNLHTPTLSGELKGLLELRDGNNRENFTGDLATDYPIGAGSPEEDPPVGIRVKVEKAWLTDPNKMSTADKGNIFINGMLYQYDGWAYNQDDKEYTFYGLTYVDANGETKKGLMDATDAGATIRIGRAIDYQGIPYYQAQMNEWVRSFAYAFNLIEQDGQDLNGNPLRDPGNTLEDRAKDVCFFQLRDAVSGDYVNILNQNRNTGSGDGSVTSMDKYWTYNDLTAKNLRLNQAIFSDASLMATTYNTESGINVDSNDLLFTLEQIKTDKNKVNFRGCSSAEFLQCILSDVALNAQSANTFTANFTNIGHALENQRLSVSGVDNDEEALDLVKFQHAFDLNSKIIQTMTEMYDRLITQTGV